MKRSHRLPAHIRPQRYEIMLKPDLENFTFVGEETIFLTIDKGVKEITLHAAEIEIGEIEGIRGNRRIRGEVKYNPKTETATISFSEFLPAGQVQLKLKFKGILNDKMRGFYRSKYSIDGVDKHIATTQ